MDSKYALKRSDLTEGLFALEAEVIAANSPRLEIEIVKEMTFRSINPSVNSIALQSLGALQGSSKIKQYAIPEELFNTAYEQLERYFREPGVFTKATCERLMRAMSLAPEISRYPNLTHWAISLSDSDHSNVNYAALCSSILTRTTDDHSFYGLYCVIRAVLKPGSLHRESDQDFDLSLEKISPHKWVQDEVYLARDTFKEKIEKSPSLSISIHTSLCLALAGTLDLELPPTPLDKLIIRYLHAEVALDPHDNVSSL